jgi:hypothetical protein
LDERLHSKFPRIVRPTYHPGFWLRLAKFSKFDAEKKEGKDVREIMYSQKGSRASDNLTSKFEINDETQRIFLVLQWQYREAPDTFEDKDIPNFSPAPKSVSGHALRPEQLFLHLL